eukprot:jgi/Galph1/1015/GphlegSOOS_G5849.1
MVFSNTAPAEVLQLPISDSASFGAQVEDTTSFSRSFEQRESLSNKEKDKENTDNYEDSATFGKPKRNLSNATTKKLKAPQYQQDSETDVVELANSAKTIDNSKSHKFFHIKKLSQFTQRKIRLPIKPGTNPSRSTNSFETASVEDMESDRITERLHERNNTKFRIPFPIRKTQASVDNQEISDVSSEEDTAVPTLEERLGDEAIRRLEQIAHEFVRDEKGRFMFYIDPARYVGNPKTIGPMVKYSLPPHFSGAFGAGTLGIQFDSGPSIPGYGGGYNSGVEVTSSKDARQTPGAAPKPPSAAAPTVLSKPKLTGEGGKAPTKALASGISSKPTVSKPPTEGLPQQVPKTDDKLAPPPAPVGKNKGNTKSNVKYGKREKKPLHWNKMPAAQLNGTVWAALNDECVDVNVDELDDLFGLDPTEGRGGNGSNFSQEEQPQQLEILPHKRRHNINVLLATLKMNSDEIKNVIYELKYKELDEDKLQALVVVSPTEEEESILREMFQEKGRANGTDSFMMELAELQGLRGKLQCALASKTFDEVARDVIADMTAFMKIPEEIMKSRKLKKVLELVLRVGNMLNGGTNRGGAVGFKLETLSTLRTFKSPKGLTLVQYIVKLLERNYPGIMPIEDEIPNLAQSAQISLEGISEDVAQVLDSITTVSQQVQKVGDDSRLRAFKEEMDAFANSSYQIRDDIVELRANLVEKLQDMMVWFGEHRNKTNRGRQEEVLKILRNFVEDMNVAKKQNVLQDKREEEKAKKAAKAAAKK